MGVVKTSDTGSTVKGSQQGDGNSDKMGGTTDVDVVTLQDRPFAVGTSTSPKEGATDAVSVHLLPGCMNPLPAHPGTALLLIDSPGLLTPNRWDGGARGFGGLF